MEGPWVGSWRPHPRRGPILAEFATPGPKYWLPGSVGHTAHDPTKYRAPAYSFRGTKCPTEESCSPGPRYFIDPLITKTGKQLAPSAQVTSRPKTKITVTPGPSELHFCSPSPRSDKVDSLPASHCSLSCRTHLHSLPLPSPGPATYTLPRILGPNTAYTHANPCYSMKWKSQYGSCFRDLAKVSSPASNVLCRTASTQDKSGEQGTNSPFPLPTFPFQLSVTKARDPAFTFGIRHSLYKAALIPETQLE
uniref:ODF3A protein n=1 Tax=Malurus cyaneus samueli TaxID=2593467 RepID=A0A8C5TLW5_9PASS